MIENVAGQLQSPSLGILNLMATKAPKPAKATKTRAPRKPSKKPKVEVVKLSKPADDTAVSDNDSGTSTDA